MKSHRAGIAELMDISVHALPITEFAKLKGLSAAVPQFISIHANWSVDNHHAPNEVVELGTRFLRRCDREDDGKCSGRAPAITRWQPLFNRNSCFSCCGVISMRPTTSSGA